MSWILTILSLAMPGTWLIITNIVAKDTVSENRELPIYEGVGDRERGSLN
jgi:hypothetical protein